MCLDALNILTTYMIQFKKNATAVLLNIKNNKYLIKYIIEK